MFEKQLETELVKAKQLILQMAVAGHNARIEFLKADLTELEKNNPALFIFCILEYYRKLAFFPDKKVIEKLNGLGLKNNELRWFIGLDEIQKELAKIENSDKVIVFPHKALLIIANYVELKITRIVFDLAKRKYGKNYVNLFKNLFKQRRYHEIHGSNSKPKNVLNETYEKVRLQIEDKDFLDDFLLKANKGRVDSILIPLLLEAGFYPKKSGQKPGQLLPENEFIWLLYDLLKLIMKEKMFMSENEFFRLKKKKGYDYRLYIIGLIKKIGRRTLPFKDYTQVE